MDPGGFLRLGCRILLLTLLAFAVGRTPALAESPDQGPRVVICSTTQVADLARQIAGNRVEVQSILAPGADPHTYQPTPRDSQKVLKAVLCLENGLHLEGNDWMGKLARDAGKPVRTCTNGIRPLTLTSEGQSMADPHAWFSPRNAAIYVNNILKALVEIDPSGQEEYEARAKLYLQQLRVLDGWIREMVNRIPLRSRVLVTSHDAFNYFCREYRFNQSNNHLSLAPVGWSTGSEVGAGMTPERRKQVTDSIKKYQARALFVETSVNPKLIQEIARESGVVIGGRLYSDSMGDKGSLAETYIGMMRENVLTIVNALVSPPSGDPASKGM